MLSPQEEKHLRDLVFEHQVVFEVRPAYGFDEGKRLQVGFDVELCGTHGQGVLDGREPQPIPGCDRCVRVWDHLDEIARNVLPPADRPTGYYVEPFDHSLRYFTKRRVARVDRPDVQLMIEIRHREGFNRDVDPCESRCLQDILASLRSLGAQEGTWNAYRARLFQRDHEADDARPSR